jgi:zinc-ribbon domain
MITCVKCGASISEQATACPQCGHPCASAARFKRIFLVAVAAAGLTLAFSVQRAFAAAYADTRTERASAAFYELEKDRSKCVEKVDGVLDSDPCWAAATRADDLRGAAMDLAVQRTYGFEATGVLGAIAVVLSVVWRVRVKRERWQSS